MNITAKIAELITQINKRNALLSGQLDEDTRLQLMIDNHLAFEEMTYLAEVGVLDSGRALDDVTDEEPVVGLTLVM